jgi:hypothetical protein
MIRWIRWRFDMLLTRHAGDLDAGAIITIRGSRIRVSMRSSDQL